MISDFIGLRKTLYDLDGFHYVIWTDSDIRFGRLLLCRLDESAMLFELDQQERMRGQDGGKRGGGNLYDWRSNHSRKKGFSKRYSPTNS